MLRISLICPQIVYSLPGEIDVTEMNSSRPIITGVSEKPNLRITIPTERYERYRFSLNTKKEKDLNIRKEYTVDTASIYGMMRTMRADLVGVSVLPVAQLVAEHGDDLVLRQVLEQVVVEQNAVDAEEAVRRGVAVARSLAAVDHLNAADAEADALRQLVNAVAERRGLHRRHLVE